MMTANEAVRKSSDTLIALGDNQMQMLKRTMELQTSASNSVRELEVKIGENEKQLTKQKDEINSKLEQLAKENKDYPAMRDLFDKNVKLIEEAIKDDPYSDDWWWDRADNRLSFAEALSARPRDRCTADLC